MSEKLLEREEMLRMFREFHARYSPKPRTIEENRQLIRAFLYYIHKEKGFKVIDIEGMDLSPLRVAELMMDEVILDAQAKGEKDEDR